MSNGTPSSSWPHSAYVYRDDCAWKVRPDPVLARAGEFEVVNFTDVVLRVVVGDCVTGVRPGGRAWVSVATLGRGAHRYQVLVGDEAAPAVGNSSPRVIIDP